MEYIEPIDDPDLDNPYAPPKAAPAQEQAMPEVSGIPFTASDIFNWSWTIFKENMGITIGLVIGMNALNVGISFGLGLILGAVAAAIRDPAVSASLNVFIQFVGMVVGMWLAIGMTRGLLRVARGQPVSFDVVFSGGPYLVPVILAGIVVGLMVIAVIFPLAGIVGIIFWMQRDSNLGLAAALVAVPIGLVIVIYLYARLFPFFYLIIDRNAGAIDSIRMSWQLTEKRAGTIILLYFIQMAIYIAGFLALCVGLIFAIPLMTMIVVVTYLALTGKAKAPARTLTTWEEEL